MSIFKQLNTKQKVFCIGFGKTGTTSVEKALIDLGYSMGKQQEAELFIHDWAKRDFKSIIKFCKSAEAFQDVPFCLPYTYIPLDQAFPKSKFILTVRNSPQKWYESLLNFHAKMFGKGQLPTADDLKNSTYRYEGYQWEVRKLLWDVPENDIYNKEILINSYIRHNEDVKEYFRHRPEDLLVLNLSEKNAYQKLCEFLGKEPLYEDFPWENKTAAE